MNIDELIARLMRLSEESPRRSATEVLLRHEGDLGIKGVSLGRARLPPGRSLTSQVVLVQAGADQHVPTTRRLAARPDRLEVDPDEQRVHEVHAEATRYRLCRAIAREIEVQEAATGERPCALEHLLRAIESEPIGSRRKGKDAGQLWLFDESREEDLARAEAICDATGAVVIHSGSRAVYQFRRDKITMPSMSRYRSRASYYLTRFYRTAFWAEKRQGWKGPTDDGKLVAAIASYILAEATGIPVVDIGGYRSSHAAWLCEVGKEPGFLARALRYGRKVAFYVLGFSEPPE